MKLIDLMEHPIFLSPGGESGSIEDEWGNYISTKTYRRSYTKIGEFPLKNPIGKHKSVDILLSKSEKSVIGVIPAKRPIDGDDGYRDVLFLMFKDTLPNYLPTELQHNKVLQVDGVTTHKELRGQGFATFVYFTLINNGFTILSDFYHEFGGLKLWRRLSRLAGVNNYVDNILDDGKFVTDKQGHILNFNDGNYPKSKIWSTSPSDAHKDVLLVMRAV